MQNSIYPIILLLVISYVDLGRATGIIASWPSSSGYSAGYPNGVIPSAVSFNQPSMAYFNSPMRLHRNRYTYQPTPWRPPSFTFRTPQMQACNQHDNIEKQLQTYIAGFEALTETIQELDAAVQEIKGCEQLSNKPVGELLNSPHQVVPESVVSTTTASEIERVSVVAAETSTTTLASSETSSPETAQSSTTESFTDATIEFRTQGSSTASSAEPSETSSPATTQSAATESFTDAPVESSSPPSSRRRRDGSHFGMPTVSSSVNQGNDDLTKASNDLKELRDVLGKAADLLKHSNYTVHSVMFRALQAYVTSIEGRVDIQRKLNTPAKGLSLKIGVIKEKVVALLAKLKALIPFKQLNISRDDRAPGITTTPAGTFNNIMPALNKPTSPNTSPTSNI